ncbi:MAG: helix-turn-helix domain-containing protein [Gammaproteobacteria bacterium]|nr:helix-turn-helix domain-containing protein [Gammaproteobacteria bacterium]
MAGDRQRTRIAVIAFDRVIAFHLSVPSLVFGDALYEQSPFEVIVCAGEPAPLTTTAGFGLTDLAPLGVLATADAVVVPGWRHALDPPPARLLAALRDAHARGAQIVGLCLGTHVLASAGLLDGRRATTHWEYVAGMAACFPAVDFDANVLYVEDGNVLTSAGTAASLDACLHVLRQRLGASVANQVARRLVIAPHREGGQAQFIERPLPRAEQDHRIARLIESVRGRLGEAHSLDSLADEVRMSRRSFTRHFKALTGTTVQAWLLAERLAQAQHLLEDSERSVEQIAEASGFGSVAAMRLQFRRAVGLSPSAWRQAFSETNAPA